MFGIPGELIVSIPSRPRFCSLFADGPFVRSLFDRDTSTTFLAFPQGAALALFYTYPSHRAAALVRNDAGTALFPGLSKTTRPLFLARASQTDKLRRALARLNALHGGAFSFPDAFYLRLSFLLSRSGRLKYSALDSLAEQWPRPALTQVSE